MSDDPYMSEYDPRLLAMQVGQEYNPYQGYPLKQVSDQVWDVYGPTPDYLIAQQFGMMNPNREDFSLDVLFAADPMLRGPLAQALAQNKGDTMGAYDYLQSPDMQENMRQQIGRTEWDQLAAQGDLRSIGAIGGEEKDQAALDYYNRGLEGLLAAGAPTSQRNMQMYDMIAERMGGMPYQGAGQTDMGFSGPGFGDGGPDPLADLAGETEEPVNLDATRQGTPFGQGMVDVGAAEGDDRIEWRDGKQLAVIGGRTYELPDTMERSGGRVNREYQRALQAVVTNRRRREWDASDEGQRAARSRSGQDKSGVARGLRDMLGMGTLIGF